MQAPSLQSGAIPVCGSKPNCVCSEHDPSDEHYIAPIELNGHTLESVAKLVRSMDGTVKQSDDGLIQATFTSGVFRFVDDLLLQADNDQLRVRSSSRVGHSDLGVNRKRVEELRDAMVNQKPG